MILCVVSKFTFIISSKRPAMKDITNQLKVVPTEHPDSASGTGKLIAIDSQNILFKSALDMLNQKLTEGFLTSEEEVVFFRAALPLCISLSGFISRRGGGPHPHWISAKPVIPDNERPVKWTGSKAEAVELIYELVKVGVLNNGQITIRQLTRWFEQEFQIELSNVYKYFQDIRNRRKETTSLAIKMDKVLRLYIDQLDDEEEIEKNNNSKRA